MAHTYVCTHACTSTYEELIDFKCQERFELSDCVIALGDLVLVGVLLRRDDYLDRNRLDRSILVHLGRIPLGIVFKKKLNIYF